MVSQKPRNALFISHANPEDNEFTVWLGAKLSAIGYEVWADVLRLRGGQDWQRRLEEALRNKSCKVLVVGTKAGMQKQGVRNEIQIAYKVGQEICDSEFIIPLRLMEFQPPFLIAHVQYIDFAKSWADGLAELLETLTESYRVPRVHSARNETKSYWSQVHLRHARSLKKEPELLVSNWSKIKKFPDSVYFYAFKERLNSIDTLLNLQEVPAIPFRDGLLSFLPVDDIQDHSIGNIYDIVVKQISMTTFLEHGWPQLYVKKTDSVNIVVELIRKSMDCVLADRGLTSYEMTGGQLAWWGKIGQVPRKPIDYSWDHGLVGKRKLIGYSEKRNLYWHYGVSTKPFIYPFPHVRIIHRVLFSKDGQNPFSNPRIMHRLRRSFTKSWRNSRWRDMLLAFLYWLSDGSDELNIVVAADNQLVLQLPTQIYISPVSVNTNTDLELEPDLNDDLWHDNSDSNQNSGYDNWYLGLDEEENTT